ncbi:hypothetical protein CFC21_059892 [Triticum aestivum]|uniref:DUF4220 domain-containing protein n=2 Tax=Triticum aestivum TaxID=4565 RepID=A0A3B6IYC0_WHEAT|nr:hypothetical protein CFC21_059892 [Triticum aestivum]
MGADQRPEELINYYAMSSSAARNIASAAGFFALLWSTVVLLGGFVSVLPVKDFWFLSLLSFLMASRMLLEMDVNTAWDYVVDIDIIRLRNQLEGGGRRPYWTHIFILSTGLIVKTTVIICVALPIVSVGPYVALALSVARLVQRDYGDVGGDAENKAKLTASLIIFYVLVTFQSLSVFYWVYLDGSEPWMSVSKQSGFGIWGPKIVRKYQKNTIAMCLKDGFLPDNWNLITFSVGLLGSATQDADGRHLWGARVLDTFIDKGIPVRQELLTSSQAIQNLIDMVIGPTRTDGPEIRERAARILADLASELRTAQFPDALRCICCLLESSKQYSDPEAVAHPLENSEQTDRNSHKRPSVESFQHGHQQENDHLSLAIIEQTDHKHQPSGELPKGKSWIQAIIHLMNKSSIPEWDKYFGDKYHYSYVSKGTKELISQGLVILERLTQNEENCIEIIKHQRLLSKIILPLSYQDFLSNRCDHTWVEILSRSLTVVSKLISVGPTDETTRLCHDMSRNTVAIRNLMCILEVDSEGARELHGQAIEILTELAFVDSLRKLDFHESTSMTETFVKTL